MKDRPSDQFAERPWMKIPSNADDEYFDEKKNLIDAHFDRWQKLIDNQYSIGEDMLDALSDSFDAYPELFDIFLAGIQKKIDDGIEKLTRRFEREVIQLNISYAIYTRSFYRDYVDDPAFDSPTSYQTS